MLSFFRFWLEQRQHRTLGLWRVLYSPANASFWLSVFVVARNSYEACREFDTNPQFSGCRRHGAPVKTLP